MFLTEMQSLLESLILQQIRHQMTNEWLPRFICSQVFSGPLVHHLDTLRGIVQDFLDILPAVEYLAIGSNVFPLAVLQHAPERLPGAVHSGRLPGLQGMALESDIQSKDLVSSQQPQVFSPQTQAEAESQTSIQGCDIHLGIIAQAPVIEIGRTNGHPEIIDNRYFGMNIDRTILFLFGLVR